MSSIIAEPAVNYGKSGRKIWFCRIGSLIAFLKIVNRKLMKVMRTRFSPGDLQQQESVRFEPDEKGVDIPLCYNRLPACGAIV